MGEENIKTEKKDVEEKSVNVVEEKEDKKIVLTQEELNRLINSAAASARIKESKKSVDVEEYNKLKKDYKNLSFQVNKDKREQEFIKLGGKKELYNIFCKLNEKLILEENEENRKTLFKQALKDTPEFFNKQFVVQAAPIMSQMNTQNIQNKQSLYEFDKEGRQIVKKILN